jgi:hypothetical protein
MKHRRMRPLSYAAERARTVRAVRAWRRLLPDWTPDLDDMRALEAAPAPHRDAVKAITYDWDSGDARWDVLLALLEHARREERTRIRLADWEMSLMAEEDAGGHDQVCAGEDFVAGSEDRQVLELREIHAAGAEVQPDAGPDEPERSVGEDQEPDAHPEGSAQSRPVLERTAPTVYRVRTLWGDGLWSMR